VSKAYGLEEDGQEGKELGVSFYVFKELRGSKEASIGEMKRIKDWFRDGMNLAGERCVDDNAKREPILSFLPPNTLLAAPGVQSPP
jgi:heme oxygenase